MSEWSSSTRGKEPLCGCFDFSPGSPDSRSGHMFKTGLLTLQREESYWAWGRELDKRM